MPTDVSRMELECTECAFSEVVEVDGEKLPGEVAVEHGKETGHTVNVSRIDEGD